MASIGATSLSIRFPSGSCGIYGLKSSTGRLPYDGIATVLGGKESFTDVKFVVGPMAGNAAQAAGNEKLVFGLMEWDGVVRPQPPICRALGLAKKVIEAAGHEIVGFEAQDHAKAVALWAKACFPDGASSPHAQYALSGEPVDPRMPAPFRADPSSVKIASFVEVMATNVAIRGYGDAYPKYWMQTASRTSTGRPVDVSLAPIAPYSATRIGKLRWFGHTTFVNVLDHPSAVIQVLKTDRNVDAYADNNTEQWDDVSKPVREDYDPDLYHGMPVGIQIIGRRLQEEKVLAVAEYLDDCLRSQPAEEETPRL